MINLCANNSNSGSVISRVIICRMYVSADNLPMLQRNVIFVGIVLNRALLGGSRSGYNVSPVLVRVIAETVVLTARLRCVSCQCADFFIHSVESV